MAARNRGNRKEAVELVMEASDHLCGEEVSFKTSPGLCGRVRGSLTVVLLSGGVSHGPRGPTSYYYMLPMKVRVQGLKVALSSKVSQVRSPVLGRGDNHTPMTLDMFDMKTACSSATFTWWTP